MALSGMQLCLVNNDPISTLLITPDGEALYSIETPPVHLPPDAKSNANPSSTAASQISAGAAPRQRSAITTVKRMERYHRSTGHTETVIGTIEYKGLVTGTHLQLCENNLHLDIPPHPHQRQSQRRIEDSPPPEEEEEEASENSWAFRGPDSRRYKWQLFVHSPVLLLDDSTFTPLARYRRAKLGIVSRSRRAFLEILPAGINLIDFIVVTFAGFMRQRLLPMSDISPSTSSSSSTQSASASTTGEEAPNVAPNSIPKHRTAPPTKGASLPNDPRSMPRPVSTKVPT